MSTTHEYELVHLAYQRTPETPLRCLQTYAYCALDVAADLARDGWYVAVYPEPHAGGIPWQWCPSLAERAAVQGEP